MIKPFYIFSFIVLSYGFPTETTFNLSNTTKTPSTSLIVKRQYSKPRIVSNIYRSNPGFMSPVNPMENLLLYILLSAGKDIDDEDFQRENVDIHDRKRSPDIFTNALGDLVNGTNGVFTRMEETFKGPRETITDLEIHPHPISQEGTCMCFNRIIRTRSNHHFEPILHPRITREKIIKNDDLKEKKLNIKKVSLSDDKTRNGLDDGLKMNFENLSGNSSLGSSVRILRVSDLIGDEKIGKTTEGKVTNGSSFSGLNLNKVGDDLDEMILELEKTPQSGEEGLRKRGNVERGPPPWLENLKSPKEFKKIPYQKLTTLKDVVKEKRNDSTEKVDDDGYYFLFYSGGTENRTTATQSDLKREPKIDLEFSNFLRKLQNIKNDDNDPIIYNQETQNLKIIKREGAKDDAALSPKDDPDSTNEDKEVTPPPKDDPVNTNEVPLSPPPAKNDSVNTTEVPSSTPPPPPPPPPPPLSKPEVISENVTKSSPTNSTLFPEDYEEEGHPPPEGTHDKTTNTYLYSVTLPTALCIILLIVGLCFLSKPAGRCCERFLRNPDRPHTERVIKSRGGSPKGSGRGSRFRSSRDDLDDEEIEKPPRDPGTYYGRGPPPEKHNVAFRNVEWKRHPEIDGGLKRGNENVPVDTDEVNNGKEMKEIEVVIEKNMDEQKAVPFGDVN